eukprot:scaffold2533_cov137-Cylindrotheca_fusiformis.AAC.12
MMLCSKTGFSLEKKPCLAGREQELPRYRYSHHDDGHLGTTKLLALKQPKYTAISPMMGSAAGTSEFVVATVPAGTTRA